MQSEYGTAMLFRSLNDGPDEDASDTLEDKSSEWPESVELLARGDPVTEPLASASEGGGSGDQIAFTHLFERYNGKICRYIGIMVGDDETARDLAQETFIKAWQALPTLRHPGQVEAWLFRIARNKAIDYLRRKRIQRILLPWTAALAREADGKLHTQGFEDQVCDWDCAREALAQVRPKLRECLVLSVIVGLSRKRIAEIVGIDENSITTYISLARKAFQEAYELVKGEKQP
jgi:RNA polymerase sigma-70 factor, ECF subfamily